MALQLAIGLKILVCDNLCFAGDLIALKRKHTAGLDLPRELAQALDRYQRGPADAAGRGAPAPGDAAHDAGRQGVDL